MVTFLIRCAEDAGVENHIKVLVAKESILLSHCTKTELPSRITIGDADTGAGICNPAPCTGLLVTVYKSAQIEQIIKAKPVLPLVDTIVGETVIGNTETVFRSKPLTHISIQTDARHHEELSFQDSIPTVITGVETVIQTDTTADKPVVPEGVGLVGTAHNVSVGVTICILLSETADGEQEACCCKGSKDFHTFHNRL